MEITSKLQISQKLQEVSQQIIDQGQELIEDKKEEIFDDSQDQKHPQIHENLKTASNLNQKSDQIQEENFEIQKPKQTRSAFHNFQKHLVITLRKSIRIKKSSHKKQPISVASLIWENFVKQTKIYTKNILHIVFGVVDYQSSDLINIYDEEIIQKFGYSQIFSQHSDSLITQAQDHLRLQVIKQLRQIDLKQIMKKRRLGDTEEFIKYVKEFVSQLQEGPMRKRLPKNKKAEMGLKMKNQQK